MNFHPYLQSNKALMVFGQKFIFIFSAFWRSEWGRRCWAGVVSGIDVPIIGFGEDGGVYFCCAGSFEGSGGFEEGGAGCHDVIHQAEGGAFDRPARVYREGVFDVFHSGGMGKPNLLGGGFGTPQGLNDRQMRMI